MASCSTRGTKWGVIECVCESSETMRPNVCLCDIYANFKWPWASKEQCVSIEKSIIIVPYGVCRMPYGVPNWKLFSWNSPIGSGNAIAREQRQPESRGENGKMCQKRAAIYCYIISFWPNQLTAAPPHTHSSCAAHCFCFHVLIHIYH